MTSATIRNAMHNQPFRPFTLHMADGGSFTVMHPDFISVSPNGREALFRDNESNSHYIDILLVLRLFAPPAPEPAELSQAEQ